MQFVVNPGGKVHGVADAEVEVLIHERGFRLATGKETQSYFKEQGLDESGNAHPETLKEIEAANERRKLGANVRQENPPTEPFATPSSDSALAKVREAKRQRVLAVEATLTPTDPMDAHNQHLNSEIARNVRVIEEAKKANEEAVREFALPTGLPSAVNQRAWLGSAEPKVEPDILPTTAHPAEDGKTIGDKLVYEEASSVPALETQNTGKSKSTKSTSDQPAELAENR